MSKIEAKSQVALPEMEGGASWRPHAIVPAPWWRQLILGPLITLAAVALAARLAWSMWNVYMVAPWTRDGTVRAYIVTMAPEVAGRIIALPVADNQFVHKGDLLMVIDPTDYQVSVRLAEAAVKQAEVMMQNARREAARRQALPDIAVSAEQQQTYSTQALAAQDRYEQSIANLDQARVNLARTTIRAPVNGWITNLIAQRGDYATVGQNRISIVDADSFWVDGYFEETSVGGIRIGDTAEIKLMGQHQDVRGHVGSIARAINVANAEPNEQGVATVNPIFTWVRLAQRIPVRINIDSVPHGVLLAAGMTATVQIDPSTPSPAR